MRGDPRMILSESVAFVVLLQLCGWHLLCLDLSVPPSIFSDLHPSPVASACQRKSCVFRALDSGLTKCAFFLLESKADVNGPDPVGPTNNDLCHHSSPHFRLILVPYLFVSV